MKREKMVIYDYDDKKVEVTLPDKEISKIFVTVLSGDETWIVVFEDGEILEFDASDSRISDYHDGLYVVDGEDIQRWLDWEFNGELCASYD